MGSTLSRHFGIELTTLLVKILVQDLWHAIISSLSLEFDAGFTEDLQEELFKDDGSHYESQRVDGTVTKIFENQGLAIINKEIYMDLCVPLPGGKKIRLGDLVVVNIRRKCEDDAWRVASVDLVDRFKGTSNTWGNCTDYFEDAMDEPHTNLQAQQTSDVDGYLKSKTIVGQITSITNNKYKINNEEVDFDIEDTNGISYQVGDWLSIKVLFDPEENQQKPKCLSVAPLRKWKFEGRINILDINKGVGVVDSDIFFQTTVCTNGYTPQIKDFVHITAIESHAGGLEFSWRAISVIPSSNNLRSSAQNCSLLTISNRENLRDTSEITVEREAQFGILDMGSEKELQIEIRNIDGIEHVLLDAKFINLSSNFEIRNNSFPVVVPVEGKISIGVHFKANTMGKIEDVLEMDFGKFIIERTVTAEAGSNSSTNGGLSSASSFLARFKQKQQTSRRKVVEEESRDNNWVMKGVRPFKQPQFTTVRLGQYPVPRDLWQDLSQKTDLVRCYSVLGDVLCPKNYCSKFQILLHMEEIETTVRLRSYDIDRTNLKPIGPYLALEVQGLAEKRPSLIIGDGVILSNPWGGGGMKYEGFVHQTLRSEVLIQFHPDFHQKYDGEDFAVHFQISRTTLRRHHTAVESSAKHPGYKVLFPSVLEMRPHQVPKLQKAKKNSVADRLFNANVEECSIDWVNKILNQEQRRAVMRILEGNYRPVPYVIYGPPGTGKTVTLVEAVLQIFLLCPRSRILVTTPSNSSADLIAHRLLLSGRLQPGDMVRLNAYSRNTEGVFEAIRPYCMSCDDIQKAVRHRILITTCTTSGKIYTMGLQHGHYTHLFIDEAGQATEPESLVPIGLLRVDTYPGQIILAGDPKQLGPVLMSQYSSAYGLNLSLLERLTLSPLYSRNVEFADTGYYNPKLLTKLVRNYRSHAALLTLPSFMFYDNELVSCAPVEIAEKLAHFSWLPNAGMPLLFHGIRGENSQEIDSPSWFNPAEVYHVVRYLQLLLNAGIDSEQIGVITPYRKQVDKIREFIKANDLCSFKVGSVEEFQGQERDVIIVSTVRSHESFIDGDVIQHLGFLRSPKRFNVTVTRAKSLLIVIGNPHLLTNDEHWGPFLKHCVQLGAYTGCDLPEL